MRNNTRLHVAGSDFWNHNKSCDEAAIAAYRVSCTTHSLLMHPWTNQDSLTKHLARPTLQPNLDAAFPDC